MSGIFPHLFLAVLKKNILQWRLNFFILLIMLTLYPVDNPLLFFLTVLATALFAGMNLASIHCASSSFLYPHYVQIEWFAVLSSIAVIVTLFFIKWQINGLPYPYLSAALMTMLMLSTHHLLMLRSILITSCITALLIGLYLYRIPLLLTLQQTAPWGETVLTICSLIMAGYSASRSWQKLKDKQEYRPHLSLAIRKSTSIVPPLAPPPQTSLPSRLAHRLLAPLQAIWLHYAHRQLRLKGERFALMCYGLFSRHLLPLWLIDVFCLVTCLVLLLVFALLSNPSHAGFIFVLVACLYCYCRTLYLSSHLSAFRNEAIRQNLQNAHLHRHVLQRKLAVFFCLHLLGMPLFFYLVIHLFIFTLFAEPPPSAAIVDAFFSAIILTLALAFTISRYTAKNSISASSLLFTSSFIITLGLVSLVSLKQPGYLFSICSAILLLGAGYWWQRAEYEFCR